VARKKFGQAGADVLITELPMYIGGRYQVIDRRRRLEGMSETETPTPEPEPEPTPEPEEPEPEEPQTPVGG
jgi:hypothetical protein